MKPLDAILSDLAATLDVALQEGCRGAEIAPEVAASFLRGRAPTATAAAPTEMPRPVPPSTAHTPPQKAQDAGDLNDVVARVAECQRCPLHATRKQTVPGVGRAHPDICFIGEAPGADEDEQGLPFVGRAGQLLTRMIEAMGYTRDEVFIANILKCRPPNNRPPTPQEMELCMPYLRRQVALVQPKVIVALGATAAQGLLHTATKIGQLRGQWTSFERIPLMPTFHPAYLLRFPAAKRDAWADLQAVLKHLGRTAPARPSTQDPA